MSKQTTLFPDISEEYKPPMKWGRQYHRGDRQGYEELAFAFQDAYLRAAVGKGKVRHGSIGVPFTEQEICTDLEALRSVTPALFQARKKIKESIRLDVDAGINELLDAMVYLGAAVIVLRKSMSSKTQEAPRCPTQKK